MEAEFYNKLIEIIPEQMVLLEEPMSRHTTFQVGGPAQYFIKVEANETLAKILLLIQAYKKEYFVLGNGSNLLVSDEGFLGVVIQLSTKENSIYIQDTTINVKAGVLLSTVSKQACTHELTGLEFAAGIPGTIGGGVVMNAGAYDGEMKDIVTSVQMIDEKGRFITLSREELEFGYRTSILKQMPVIVTEITLELQQGNTNEISTKMKQLATMRKEKQPLSVPNAGSTFKRPTGYYAGKLIMEAGLSGYRIGGASVSMLHCGFVVNDQQGTAADIYALLQHIIVTVQQYHAITLEPEIICLGTF